MYIYMYTLIVAQDIGTRWKISWGSCPSWASKQPRDPMRVTFSLDSPRRRPQEDFFKVPWDPLYPFSHHHGSVENGCISNIYIYIYFFFFFSSRASFHFHDYGRKGTQQ